MGAKDQPFVPDLSHITGKTAASRNKAIQSLIKEDLPDMKFTHMPEYSPFINSGVAMKDMGTHVGFKKFSSRLELRRVLVHEELHHRWFKRNIPGPLHHSNDYVPNEKFYKVIERYFKMRGWDY